MLDSDPSPQLLIDWSLLPLSSMSAIQFDPPPSCPRKIRDLGTTTRLRWDWTEALNWSENLKIKQITMQFNDCWMLLDSPGIEGSKTGTSSTWSRGQGFAHPLAQLISGVVSFVDDRTSSSWWLYSTVYSIQLHRNNWWIYNDLHL